MRRRVWVLTLIQVLSCGLVALEACAPAFQSTAPTIQDVYEAQDQSLVAFSGQVTNLELERSYANFDVYDSASQIHVYWPLRGATAPWLAEGACVRVEGQYQVKNSYHNWEPQVEAKTVYAHAAGCVAAPTRQWMLVSYGGAEYVAGSCHLVRTDEYGFLVDCGSFMSTDDMPVAAGSRRRDDEGFSFGPAGLAAVVVTHAHDDHVGRLHYLVYQGFRGPIHMTEATAVLYKAKLHALIEWSTIPEEMHNRIEGQVRAQIKTHAYLEPFAICEGASGFYVDAGHIPGSASLVLSLDTGSTSLNVTFSGDLGSGHHPFLEAPDQSSLSKTGATTLVVESTYGGEPGRVYPEDSAELYGEFWSIVATATERGHLTIIPTFSLDRTQRVLAALLEGVVRGILPSSLRIGVGGDSSCDLTRTYIALQNDTPLCQRYFSDRFCSLRPLDPLKWDYLREGCCCNAARESTVDYRAYDVIVTPSGNGSRPETATTLSHELLKQYVDQSNVTIVKVGWAPEWTPMGKLGEEGARAIEIDGVLKLVRAEIRPVQDVFSGHADVNALVEYVRCFPNLGRLIIVHGDDERGSREGLEGALEASLGWPATVQILRPAEALPIDLQ